MRYLMCLSQSVSCQKESLTVLQQSAAEKN
nr:MAG TPA: hypothetical protein [Caudoviricetes sp.]